MINEILKERYIKISKVKTEVDNLLRLISEKHNSIIVLNCINKMGFDLVLDGAITKSHLINLKTQKNGIFGGYILVDNKEILSRPITRKFNNEYFLFLKDGSVINSEKLEDFNCNDLIFGLTDKEGIFITSDIDILLICSMNKTKNNIIDYSVGMGDLLEYEYEIILNINKLFTNFIKMKSCELANVRNGIVNIVQHGPLNRYKNIKLEDINFPIEIYHPKNGKMIIKFNTDRKKSIEEFFFICKNFKAQGYNVDINKNWIKDIESKSIFDT